MTATAILTSRPLPQPLDLAALVGAEAWHHLPAVVQHRFAAGHADAVYEGRMDLRCSRIGSVYALLSKLLGGPLSRMNATGLPATVRVSSNGLGGVVWERRFHRSGGSDRVVRSTKEIDPVNGQLLERTDGGLSMQLHVFEQDGALVFQSRRYCLLLGAWRLPVPALLSPGVCTVTHTALGGSRFRFTLRMVHPLWGETFHQTGVFTDPS